MDNVQLNVCNLYCTIYFYLITNHYYMVPNIQNVVRLSARRQFHCIGAAPNMKYPLHPHSSTANSQIRCSNPRSASPSAAIAGRISPSPARGPPCPLPPHPLRREPPGHELPLLHLPLSLLSSLLSRGDGVEAEPLAHAASTPSSHAASMLDTAGPRLDACQSMVTSAQAGKARDSQDLRLDRCRHPLLRRGFSLGLPHLSRINSTASRIWERGWRRSPYGRTPMDLGAKQSVGRRLQTPLPPLVPRYANHVPALSSSGRQPLCHICILLCLTVLLDLRLLQ